MLTERQKKLITLLGEFKGEYVNKKTICSNVPEYERNLNPNSHDICNQIGLDKTEINKNIDSDIIIISNSKGEFKIAETEKEINGEIDTYFKKGIRALVKASNLRKKVKLNNTMEYDKTFDIDNLTIREIIGD